MKKWISVLLSIMLLIGSISVLPASALAMVDKTGKIHATMVTGIVVHREQQQKR